MNDMLMYMSKDPLFRRGCHDKLTFSLTYAFSEGYILPLSHDEVVHGKASLIAKMPGEYEQKFSNLRAFLAYQMTHPGKKLLFMGGELAQFIEWDYKKELDWLLLGYERHRQFSEFVRELNHFYLSRSELWEADGGWDGFKWIAADDTGQNIIVFRRINRAGRELVVLCNFSPVRHTKYCIGAPGRGTYRVIFNTDDKEYGGTGFLRERSFKPVKSPMHGFDVSLELTVPPMCTLILEEGRRRRETL